MRAPKDAVASMSRATLLLVLVVSCAHGLVHCFELSLPAVEQLIAKDYQADKAAMGLLANCWRLPFGAGALFAGWLVDRYGANRLLALYLFGCAAACVTASIEGPFGLVFGAMFVMGLSGSIYHPAGLSLISHHTDARSRPKALGLHGIFGSLGIGATPFLAGALLSAGLSWRQFYLALAVPGVIFGLVFAWRAARWELVAHGVAAKQPQSKDDDQDHVDWACFFVLVMLATSLGFVYAAVVSFLPRYLSDGVTASAVEQGNYFAGAVLLVGCFGQYFAARIASPERLERQLTGVALSNVPCLLAMAFAPADWKVWAAGVFAFVHFMNQPIYNSLIAKYTPRHRRSLCYGFSFAMSFGIGSFGATFAGFSESQRWTYSVLAGVALVASILGTSLVARNRW